MKETDIRSPQAHEQYLAMVHADARTFFSDPAALESCACPACKSAVFQPAFEKFGFTYGTCPSCRTLYVNPRPRVEPLKNFYVNSPSSRFWVEHFFKPVAEARREKIFRPRAAHLAGLLPGMAREKIGDVGAGFGLFLEEMRRFWPEGRFVAIEPSPEMAAICRAKGLVVEESTIEDMQEKNGGFGILTAFELLEHLHTPESLVAKAYRLLRPGGYFVATTLSGEGFDIQVLWENSRSVFPPHHLNFLNPDSLAKLCRDNGFTIVAAETPGQLDWQIVEGAARRDEPAPGRFWNNVARHGSDLCKQELQEWLARNRLSSHMRIIAQKPLS